MKLQKQVAYKYKNKTHYKYVIIIPETAINELGWHEGQEINYEVDRSLLLLRPSKNI